MTAVAIATFASEGAWLRARTRLVADEHRLLGQWLPYAADSLGDGDGTKGIRSAAIVAGMIGFLGLFALTVWSTMIAYPFDSGGRPPFSWPAFLPAAIEVGALIGGVGGLVMLFRNGRLTRLHDAAFDFAEVERASLDAFVLAVGCDAGADANRVLAILAEAGATHSRLIGG